jgi:hypothetical protein
VPLLARQYHPVHVFSASVLVPYVTPNLHTLTKVEHVVTAKSTVMVPPLWFYVVPKTVALDGLSPMPSQIGFLKESHRKCELLHFGYVAR